ncbi:MAG: hypothetical protein KUG48_01790 [Oleibacter sp.]|nr:hypothetical protein [Thalassolituus sp.]
MVTTIKIEKKRGDTKRHVFILKDAEGGLIDISSWSNFKLTVDPQKLPSDSSANIFQINGSLITDGTDGQVGFTPPGSAAPGRYFYDAQADDSNGEKITFAEGGYKITQDITKD